MHEILAKYAQKYAPKNWKICKETQEMFKLCSEFQKIFSKISKTKKVFFSQNEEIF